MQALIKDANTMADNSLSYTLADFINHINLLQQHNMPINRAQLSISQDSVKLMTAHRSKGLEFEYVFLIRAYKGKWGDRVKRHKFVLPVKDVTQDEENADERRLFFVALTRAKRAVFISFAQVPDNSSSKERLPSVFVQNIGEEFLNTPDTQKEQENIKPEDLLIKTQNTDTFADKEYLQTLFIEQGLSVTALNNFLNCPWNFFYSNLIRVPKMQNKHLILGNATHHVLFLINEHIRKTGSLLAKADIKQHLQDFLRKKALNEQVYEELFEKALEAILGYIDYYKDSLLQNRQMLNEYNITVDFDTNFDYLPKVKLTGVLDKVEVKAGNEVTVFDYKTGQPKSKNHILGNTKAQDAGNYIRQLRFYNLLLSIEGKYEMTQGIIDFIEPKKTNGKYKREKFEGADIHTSSLKDEINFAVDNIYNLNFWDSRCENHSKGKCEYCKLRDLMR